MPSFFAFFKTLPRPLRPFQDGFFGIFVRLDDGQLRRESERTQYPSYRTGGKVDMEDAANQIGDDFRGPAFGGVSCGDGAFEDDFLELLFLYVIEFRLASGTFFSCEGVEFAVGLLEFPPPIFDGRSGDFGNVVVVISFEDQLAPLKPRRGLGR